MRKEQTIVTDEPNVGARLLKRALGRSLRQRRTLAEIEEQVPGTRAFAVRFAASVHGLGMADQEEVHLLRRCIAAGLSSYRLARYQPEFDLVDALATFVAGLSQRCEDDRLRALVAKALTDRQRRLIADRLPVCQARAG
jgi:hypothetical protein